MALIPPSRRSVCSSNTPSFCTCFPPLLPSPNVQSSMVSGGLANPTASLYMPSFHSPYPDDHAQSSEDGSGLHSPAYMEEHESRSRNIRECYHLPYLSVSELELVNLWNSSVHQHHLSCPPAFPFPLSSRDPTPSSSNAN